MLLWPVPLQTNKSIRGVYVSILMLFFVKVLAPHCGELKGHSIDHVLCGDLRLESEPSVDIVVAFFLLIEHPTASADHDVFSYLGKVRGNIHLGFDGLLIVVVVNVDWGNHHGVVDM